MQVTRRGVLIGGAIVGAAGLSGCGPRDFRHGWDGDPEERAPKSVSDLLRFAKLSQPPVEPGPLTRIKPAEGYLWTAQIEFTADPDAVGVWLERNLGSPSLPRAGAGTPPDLLEALGRSSVPESWMLGTRSVMGTPYSLIVLVEDADSPRHVIINVREVDD